MSRNKKQAYTNYKMSVVQAIKNRACVDCSCQKAPERMTFDHLPGSTKRFTIGSAYAKETLKSLLREILKCDVVCRTCHTKREMKRRLLLDEEDRAVTIKRKLLEIVK